MSGPVSRRDAAGKAEPLEAVEGDRLQWQRLVQPQPEHDSLGSAHRGRERLQFPVRSVALANGREVKLEPRRRPPALAAHGRNRADPEADVVTPAPVREVVAGGGGAGPPRDGGGGGSPPPGPTAAGGGAR